MADISLRAGDVITVPKRPSFVVSFGQVYNPNAITYKPGKTAEWYLKQAGGPTELAYKKGIYIIRANGSVVSSSGTERFVWWWRFECTNCSPATCWWFPKNLSAGLRRGRQLWKRLNS